jgi:hypothetical protein
VPANHPLAQGSDVLPPPSGVVPAAAAQAIYAVLEGLPATVSASGGGIRSFQGWAVDCALGTLPPSMKLMETKPDGSTREVPNDFNFITNVQRFDVQAEIGGSCPAVYHVPLTGGGDGGSFAGFGWSFQLRSPITEVGTHTFTLTWAWPAQGHSGATSKTVNIVP